MNANFIVTEYVTRLHMDYHLYYILEELDLLLDHR